MNLSVQKFRPRFLLTQMKTKSANITFYSYQDINLQDKPYEFIYAKVDFFNTDGDECCKHNLDNLKFGFKF